MISRTAEYAVRAALWLAAHPVRPFTVQEIARATAVPAGYLAKVLQLLGRAGILRAQPGPGGGFMLARNPEQVNLLSIIQAIEPFQRIQTCPLGLQHPGGRLCPLHLRLDRALEAIQQALGSCTLADLLAEGGEEPFCRQASPAARDLPSAGVAGGPDIRAGSRSGHEPQTVEGLDERMNP